MDDLDSVLSKLSEKAKADFALAESNRLLIDAEVKRATAENLKNALLTLQTEQAAGLIAGMSVLIQTIEAVREWQEEASERLERLERAAILGLSGRSDGELLTALKHTEHISSLKRQLSQQIENLNTLQEERAESGFNLTLENKIKKTSARIEELKAELDGLNR